jgi:uncharacterized protein (DUF1501 family)
MNHFNASRRLFMRQSAALSSLGVGGSFALNLAGIGAAAAQNVATDYKALVCVFLQGANDNFNTLIPTDPTSRTAYEQLRGGIALSAASVLPLAPKIALPNGRSFALAPSMSKLKTLFDSDKLAVLLNVGTLAEPITKQQYLDRSKRLPPKLFSHNDQVSLWQASNPEGARSGWGGRMGDLFAANNKTQTFTSIGVNSNPIFLSGNTISQYQITSNGSIQLNAEAKPVYGSRVAGDAVEAMITQTRTHLMEREHTRVADRALNADAELRAALGTAAPLTTLFPDTNLGKQLAMVARLIAVRNVVGAKRQVFYVSLGSFDHHSDLLDQHGPMLQEVSDAMAAFYTATVEMNVANAVTSFTASDFGRTLTVNGDGSDHGWGSFHFALGGAVNGRQLYGDAPEIANNGANDVGQGRLIPTRSVDQYAATLAKWFGVSGTDMDLVLPGLKNFSGRDLGFMA